MDAEVRRAYAVLELTPPVGADALRKQYRLLAKRWHPDRHAYDPAAQADASDRMRRINDAFRLVASSLETAAPAPEPPPASRWSSPRRETARMSREEIEELVASINRSNTWTPWPSMSRDRWYSLGAVAACFAMTAALPPRVGRLMALGAVFLWLPLVLIWMADSESVPPDARPWLRRVGWTFMALPLAFGLLALLP